jgi:hypothetical protein
MENCKRLPSPDCGHNQEYIIQVCWLLPSFVMFAFKHLLIFITYEITQLDWVLYQTWKSPEERTAEAADNPPSYPKNCLQPPAALEVKNFETYYPQIVRLNNSEQFGMAITKKCKEVCRYCNADVCAHFCALAPVQMVIHSCAHITEWCYYCVSLLLYLLQPFNVYIDFVRFISHI